mmetsp:Transcript_53196/g.84839  ORF Transcript_53196/g.84839 Transcript_53196/m.84839 type:complete len:82 (+) Transcript_53196:1654-1899(+)
MNGVGDRCDFQCDHDNAPKMSSPERIDSLTGLKHGDFLLRDELETATGPSTQSLTAKLNLQCRFEFRPSLETCKIFCKQAV